jgi:3-dehydroquinate synthetase
LKEKIKANAEAVDEITRDKKLSDELEAQRRANIDKTAALKTAEIDKKASEEETKKYDEEQAKRAEEFKKAKDKENKADEIKADAADKISKMTAGKDKSLSPISVGGGALQSIGGYFATQSGVRAAQGSKSEQLQEKIAMINEEMLKALQQLNSPDGGE